VSQDNAEFAEFFAASWDPCLRAVAASTGDMALAEDQTAEAFARAWASWHKVSRHQAPRAWVVRTALNAGASWWRRRSKETALTSHDIAAADSQGTGLDTPVLTALRRLPARQPGALKPGDLNPSDRNRIIDHTVTVINPAAMPSGTELFFGYFNSDHALFFDLIYTRSYTCSNGAQPPANP
jgi:hypothetical protein